MRTKTLLLTALAALAFETASSAQSNKLLCSPPQQGDWIVAQDRTFQGQATAPANVVVLGGITLTVAPGADLNIDFASHHLRVRAKARVIVGQRARIR